MEFSDKIQLALDTPIGSFLIFISTSFICLLIIYLSLSLRQRKHNSLVLFYQENIQALKKLHPSYEFSKQGTSTPFGKLIPITQKTTKNASQCLLIDPKLFNNDIHTKFLSYISLSEDFFLSHTVSYEDLNVKPLSVIVHGLWTPNQKKLISCHELLMDKKLSHIQAQHLTLEIASFLSKLHKTKDSTGSSLFHGFLCPLTLMINLNINFSIESFKFSFTGLPYALGKDFQFLINKYKKTPSKSLNHFEKDLVSQLDFFAPEYFLESLQENIGSHSDVYSFAKLILFLFSSSNDSMENIPNPWKLFIKKCLDPVPSNRPKDLLRT